MYPNSKPKLWSAGVGQNELAGFLQVDEAMLPKVINGYPEPGTEMRGKIVSFWETGKTWLLERAASERARN